MSDAQRYSVQQCKQNEKVASGYPIPLYHATIDRTNVCKIGLLPSCEAKKSALGQCNTQSKTISFTVDKKIAETIAHDLQTFVELSNNFIRADCSAKEERKKLCTPIEKHLEKHDAFTKTEISPTPQTYLIENLKHLSPQYRKYLVMEKGTTKRKIIDFDGTPLYALKIPAKMPYISKISPASLWNEAINQSSESAYNYAMMRKGFVKIDFTTSFAFERDINLRRAYKQYKAEYGDDIAPCYGDQHINDEEDVVCIMARRMKNTTPEEMIDLKQRQLYEMWSFQYLPLREKSGGLHNPWFAFSAQVNSPRKNGLKKEDVGIFQVTAYFPKPWVNYGDNETLKISAQKEINDFDFAYDPYDSTNYGKNYIPGEQRNKEVRIVREMFNNLHEI